MSSTNAVVQEEHNPLAEVLYGMYDFGRNEKIADDEKIWITKREAFLITDFIAWQARRYRCDKDVSEEQQD